MFNLQADVEINFFCETFVTLFCETPEKVLGSVHIRIEIQGYGILAILVA